MIGRQGRKHQNGLQDKHVTFRWDEQIKQSVNALNWLLLASYLNSISLSDQKDQRDVFRLFFSAIDVSKTAKHPCQVAMDSVKLKGKRSSSSTNIP